MTTRIDLKSPLSALWLTGCLLLALLTLPLPAYSKDKNASLVVFAAASLTEPLTAIGQTYTQQSGVSINFSFAASSLGATNFIRRESRYLFVGEYSLDAIFAHARVTPARIPPSVIIEYPGRSNVSAIGVSRLLAG